MEEDFGISSTLLHMTYLHTLVDNKIYSLASVLWYMGLIIQLYIVGYYLHFLRKKNKFWPFFVILLLYFIAFNIEFPLVTRRFVGGYIIIFYLGMWSNLNYNNIVGVFNKKRIFYSYILLFLLYVFNEQILSGFNFKYIDYTKGSIYLFFPLFILIIENLKNSTNFIFKAIVYIGEISFTLYLFNYSYRIIHKEMNLHGISGIIVYFIFLVIFSSLIEATIKKISSKQRA
jgi:peptidoglycan/LPS O-acetylase OafA/YrhL